MGSLQQATLILHQHLHPVTAAPCTEAWEQHSARTHPSCLHPPASCLVPAAPLQIQVRRRKRNEGCAREELPPAMGDKGSLGSGQYSIQLQCWEFPTPLSSLLLVTLNLHQTPYRGRTTLGTEAWVPRPHQNLSTLSFWLTPGQDPSCSLLPKGQ